MKFSCFVSHHSLNHTYMHLMLRVCCRLSHHTSACERLNLEWDLGMRLQSMYNWNERA